MKGVMNIFKVIYPKRSLNSINESVQKQNFIEIKQKLKSMYLKEFCDYYYSCTVNVKESKLHFRIVQNGKIECNYGRLNHDEFEVELGKIKSVFEKYYEDLY